MIRSSELESTSLEHYKGLHSAKLNMPKKICVEMESYLSIRNRLPIELQYLIDEYASVVEVAIQRFEMLGPLSYFQNRSIGFARGQSPAVFGIPSLKSQPYWTDEMKSVLNLIGLRAEDIRNEFKQCADFDILQKQKKGNMNEWTAYYLMEEGSWNSINTSKCPVTMAVLSQLPICECTLGYAYFSVLQNGVTVAPHFGVTNCKLRLQFPLNHDALMNAAMNVGGVETRYQPGTGIVFDDSYMHTVINRASSSPRVVLLVDIWHPQLNRRQRDRIAEEFSPQIRLENCDDHIWVKGRTETAEIVEDGFIQRKYDFLFKLLLIGTNGVGKSSFLLKFVDNVFHDHYMSTIGVDFKLRTISRKGKSIKLQIWDPAGPERFRTLTTSYFKGAHGIFLFFDLTDRNDFSCIDHWWDQARNASPLCTYILVGTKVDLESKREVDFDEAVKKAAGWNIPYFEISSKTGFGIEALINKFVSCKLRQMVVEGEDSVCRQPMHVTPKTKPASCGIQ